MSVSEESDIPWEIKIPPGLQVDVQEHWLPITASKNKLIKLSKEHRILILEMEASRIRFWNMMEQHYPEIINNPCHFDSRSMSIKSGHNPEEVPKP